MPLAIALVVHCVFAGPVLHLVGGGVWRGPGHANGIHFLLFSEIDDDPLRVQRIIFAGESLSEVWIAFPIRVQVSGVQAGEAVELCAAVAGVSGMLQGIAIRWPVHFLRRRSVAWGVSLPPGITPSPFRVPS